MARTITGVVTSKKTAKTIVITVKERKTHPIYKKQYTESRSFMAHDEKDEAREGDTVTIVETRPMSARKRFALQSINAKADLAYGVKTEDEEVSEQQEEKS